MVIRETPIEGAYVVEGEGAADERGEFVRLMCAADLAKAGLETRFVQSSVSRNTRRGTLRGLHYQAPPHEEVKLVGCLRGAAFDVMVDLRRDSASYLRHFASELTAANRLMHYIPKGVAHGFQTLSDDTELIYFISEPYDPALARGVRWNDPRTGIAWPVDPAVLSPRDRELPLIGDL
jgi:dTDP-4-dehydrorhamnose 3,5-epimerase